MANTWGYIRSFGVFQIYYVSALGHAPSDISWVGSAQIFLLFITGTFSRRATYFCLFKPTVVLGSFFMLLRVFMTSLSTKYVSYAVSIIGSPLIMVGTGSSFSPKDCVQELATGCSSAQPSLLPTYFTTKRSLAMGIGA